MRAGGGDERNLTRNGAGDGDPVFSPGGGAIAFQSNRAGNFEIYLMRADGSHVRRLTHRRARTSPRPSRRAAGGSPSRAATTATGTST
jgi:Tol biopolymer transport system component